MSKEKLLNLGDDAGLTLVKEKISTYAKKTQNFSRNTKLWLVNINMLTLWKTFLWLTDHVRAWVIFLKSCGENLSFCNLVLGE